MILVVVVGGVLLCFFALTNCSRQLCLQGDPWTCLWSNRAFALHQWGMHQGKPEQRINRVKELGYLFVEERPPAACDRLPH